MNAQHSASPPRFLTEPLLDVEAAALQGADSTFGAREFCRQSLQPSGLIRGVGYIQETMLDPKTVAKNLSGGRAETTVRDGLDVHALAVGLDNAPCREHVRGDEKSPTAICLGCEFEVNPVWVSLRRSSSRWPRAGINQSPRYFERSSRRSYDRSGHKAAFEDSRVLRRKRWFSMGVPRCIVACAALVFAASVLVGEPFAASPRAQLNVASAHAQQVLQQVNALDVQFERAVEAWHGAQYELGKARAQLSSDRAMLRFAQQQRRIALARVRARLIALYESSDTPTSIEIFLGSSTFSDMLAGLDAAQMISASDHALALQTTAARDRYALVERRTQANEESRAAAVTHLQSERAQIGAMLSQRRQLLSSIQSQIARLQAAEARRQAILAAQARARLVQEHALLRQQAAQSARATTAAQAAPLPDPAAAALAPPLPAQLVSATSMGGGHPEAATIAMHYLGVPYVWGGSTPAGFDCSGLVMYVYAQLGISLPHFAAAQYGFGGPVASDQLQPGDLVFFDGLNHVGIYVGGGDMVNAPHTGDVVKVTPLSAFGAGYVGARRL
ncbi:MAG: peptidoglycan DL-endopeptidase CwlO [Gaiellaceae bacterium]|nr:peptidoglycan DL-endopeptidase CwlO [Gaiellaceae bacterium]